MKTCNKCELTLPVSSFYLVYANGPQRAPVRRSFCKECCKKIVIKFQKDNPDKVKVWNKISRIRYYAKPESKKRAFLNYKKGMKRPEYRQARMEASRRYWAKNRDKRLAHQALNNAVKSGRINRPNICSMCNKVGKIQGHHHLGYSKENRFNVIWLCRSCHEWAHHSLT